MLPANFWNPSFPARTRLPTKPIGSLTIVANAAFALAM